MSSLSRKCSYFEGSTRSTRTHARTNNCAGKKINPELASEETYAGHYCSSDPNYKTQKAHTDDSQQLCQEFRDFTSLDFSPEELIAPAMSQQ